MIKIDWAKAPKEATHALFLGPNASRQSPWFYQVMNNYVFFKTPEDWSLSNHTAKQVLEGGDAFYVFIPRVKPRIKFRGSVPIYIIEDTQLTIKYLEALQRVLPSTKLLYGTVI